MELEFCVDHFLLENRADWQKVDELFTQERWPKVVGFMVIYYWYGSPGPITTSAEERIKACLPGLVRRGILHISIEGISRKLIDLYNNY